MSAVEVGRTSLWQFNAAWAGFQQWHGADMDAGLSDAEVDELGSWLDQLG